MRGPFRQSTITRLTLVPLAAFSLSVRAGPEESPLPPAGPLQERARRIREEVEAIRGLRFKSDVPIETKTAAELTREMRQERDKEFPVEKERESNAVAARFGVIPRNRIEPDRDRLIPATALYREHLKKITIVGKVPEQLIDVVLSHELYHALQDQHWGLGMFENAAAGNEDAAHAIRAFVEGEAVCIQNAYRARKSGRDPDAEAPPSPRGNRGKPTLEAMTTNLNYDLGCRFVNAVKKSGGWEGVAKVHEDLPASTEQILHPVRKYIERDFPQRIDLGELKVADRWKPACRDVAGEFQIRSLLIIVNEKENKEGMAAAGWDGDCYAAFKDKDLNILLVWGSVWDSEEDALEFHDAYTGALHAKHPAGANGAAARRGDRIAWSSDDLGEGCASIEARGSRVLVVEGASSVEEADGLAGQAWKNWRAEEIRPVAR